MFSKELENLIQATLEDGVLEDNEKAALIKRAQKEGVDLDELEIYINSLLQKRQRELREKNDSLEKQYEQEKKKAVGPVCPKCGKQVPPLTLKCDCGYEFITQKQVSSIQMLSEKILKVQSEKLADDYHKREGQIKQQNQTIIDLITMFPVPNTKEDIVEFLSLAAPNSKTKGGMWGTVIGRIKILSIVAVIGFILCLIFGGKDGAAFGAAAMICIAFYGGMACFMIDQDSIRHNKRADAWRAKFEQVLMKGRSLRGDADFQQQLDYYENMLNKK